MAGARTTESDNLRSLLSMETTETLQFQGKEGQGDDLKRGMKTAVEQSANNQPIKAASTRPDNRTVGGETSDGSDSSTSEPAPEKLETCEGTCKCNDIYPDQHIKKREDDERILESLGQFCASFYHVHQWDDREHSCLDQDTCRIAIRARGTLYAADKFSRELKKTDKAARRISEVAKWEKSPIALELQSFPSEAHSFARSAKEYARTDSLSDKDKESAEKISTDIDKIIRQFAPNVSQLKKADSQSPPKVRQLAKAVRQLAKDVSSLVQKAIDLVGKARQYAWCKQPKTVVGVVKFKNEQGIIYQARYTNCYKDKKHAEDFFHEDITDEQGEFKKKIQSEAERRTTQDPPEITLYLTYQPCNKSINSNGTEPTQSCCNILEKIVTEILQPKAIKLCVKVAHVYTPDTTELEQFARSGIERLMNIGGNSVTISRMEQDDWKYLFTMTNDRNRENLDTDVEKMLSGIRDASVSQT